MKYNMYNFQKWNQAKIILQLLRIWEKNTHSGMIWSQGVGSKEEADGRPKKTDGKICPEQT